MVIAANKNARHVCLPLSWGGSWEAVEEAKRVGQQVTGGRIQEWALKKHTHTLWKNRVGVRICVCFADGVTRVSVFRSARGVTADLTEEDEQSLHSASAATQLILSFPSLKEP